MATTTAAAAAAAVVLMMFFTIDARPSRSSSGYNDNESTESPPWEIEGMFEGDIDIMNETSRNAIRNDDMKWAGAVVPYVIAGSYDARARQVMQSAFDEYRQKTCVRFVPRTNQRAFINIEPFSGCSSAVGKQGRVQRVSLTRGCVTKGIVAHELMHAIGFWHEQSRADRDSFVRINFENILPNQRYNFQKYTLQAIQHLGEPYDYSSVMHYGPRAFSTGAGPSITPLRSGVTIGQRNGLSRIDVNKINKLYNCNTGGSTPAPTTAPTADCQNENTQCESWAGRGQCQANPRYMLANCRPACGVCGDSTCNDGNRLCPYWASIGECQKNPGYMLPNCQFSCETCQTRGGGDTCVNDNVSCESWAGRGECQKNPRYMRVNCKKACDVCDNNEVATSCTDDNRYCMYWASKGECEANPDYMLTSCKISCKTCAKSPAKSAKY